MSSKSVVDVFEIDPKAIPALTAYTLKTETGDATAVGGKLAYRLRSQLGGIWVWTNNLLIYDTPVAEGKLADFLKGIWGDGDEALKDVQSILPYLD